MPSCRFWLAMSRELDSGTLQYAAALSRYDVPASSNEALAPPDAENASNEMLTSKSPTIPGWTSLTPAHGPWLHALMQQPALAGLSLRSVVVEAAEASAAGAAAPAAAWAFRVAAQRGETP